MFTEGGIERKGWMEERNGNRFLLKVSLLSSSLSGLVVRTLRLETQEQTK